MGNCKAHVNLMIPRKEVTVMKYVLVKRQDLKAKILEVIQTIRSTNFVIQNLSVSILTHAAKHGDWSLDHVNTLILGCVGVRSELLSSWFATYGGYTRKPGESEFTGWKGVDHVKANLPMAKAAMWFDKAKKEDAFKDISFDTKLNQLLNQINKSAVKAKTLELQGGLHDNIDLAVKPTTIERLLNMAQFDHLLLDDSRVEVKAANEPAAVLEAESVREGAEIAA